MNGDATVNPGRSEGNPNPITLGDDPVYDGTADLRIGVRYWDPPGWQNPEDPAYQAFMQGGISELIIFKGELDSTQMILIENYLATKYNTELKEDYALYNDSVYIYDFIGIGTQTGGDIHNMSSRAGFMLEGLNASVDTAGDYLMAAHNGMEIEYIDSTIAVEDMERWTRIWNISKKGSIDSKISFDFFEAGMRLEDASMYALLYRESDTSDFSPLDIDATIKFKTLSFEVTNEMLVSGQYTLGHVVEPSGGTSISSLALSDNISIFPNPATGDHMNIVLSMDGTGPGNLRILDYTGKQLYTEEFLKTTSVFESTLPVASLENGVYFIEITFNNKKGMKSFVKK